MFHHFLFPTSTTKKETTFVNKQLTYKRIMISLEEKFQKALRDLNALPKNVELPEKTKLRLYGLYSYVVKGPNLPPVNLEFLIKNKMEALKRKAWKEALKLSRNQAMEEYCEIAKELQHNNETRPTISGILYRKDHKRGWKNCYLELKDRVLYYYELSEKETEKKDQSYPSGVLFLMDGLVVTSSDEGNCSDKPGSPAITHITSHYRFSIAHPKSSKVFILAAPTIEERQEWINAIRLESQKKSSSLMDMTKTKEGALLKNTEPELYRDSFANTSFLPPIRSSQDLGVPTEYSFRVDDCLANFINLISDVSLWAFSHEKLNVKTFIQKCERFPGIGEGINCIGVMGDAVRFDSPARSVFELVWNLGSRRNIDPQLQSWSIVEELGPQTRVDHVVYSAVWPTSRRDFCRLCHYRVDNQTSAIAVISESVEHILCPILRDCVRAKLFCTGFLITPLSETSCRVKYLILIDPIISSVPRRYVLSVATSQTSILEKMQKYLSERDYLKQGALLKGPLKNVTEPNTHPTVNTPNMIPNRQQPSSLKTTRRRKKSTGGSANSSLLFVKNTDYLNSSFREPPKLPPGLTSAVVHYETENHDILNRLIFLVGSFFLYVCTMISLNQVLNFNQDLFLVVVFLFLLVVVFLFLLRNLDLARRKPCYIQGFFTIPIRVSESQLNSVLVSTLKKFPSINGNFSLFGTFIPSPVPILGCLNHPLLHDVVIANPKDLLETFAPHCTSKINIHQDHLTALFVTFGLIQNHETWTRKPVLFSMYSNRLFVSIDRRCNLDFIKFCDTLQTNLNGNEASPTTTVTVDEPIVDM